ncbi:MAG: FMN-binding glutamate synthase family protein [Chloroflexi bacterium]|nr:FMN-binding glutamate synthase family protein [Chloroflexota bacterium]
MSGIHENSRSTTGTVTRSRDISPVSGMCPICVRECTFLCEIGKSAFRGREVLYPNPEEFGKSTQASNKDYYLDWSHFQINVEVRGAKGIEADSDKAIFPNVDISTTAGGVPLKVPVIVAGLGSTAVAKNNWPALGMGTSLSGTIMTVGENVCGMDPDAKFDSQGKVIYSKDLKFRVDTYRKTWDGKHGDIVIQTNVEDQRAGVDVYALKSLGVNIIERKWGQGAKAIGGEVRIFDLDRALMLKNRGYIVLPDPEDKAVQGAFKGGVFNSFERHSRVGMPQEKSFVEDIAWLRSQGARKVFLKTGAYNVEAVAFTLKCASQAKIDLLTFDGGGGGTGMSPVPMMQECSTPTLYLYAQVMKGIEILKKRGKHIPDIAFAGGFVNETQILKAIAMSNLGDGHGPYIKTIAMARAPITAAMKADYFVELAARNALPGKFGQLYGTSPEKFFVSTTELSRSNGHNGHKLGSEVPWGAVGIYTYFVDRIGTGLKQLMAGCRKWKLDLLDRNDVCALTEHASKITGVRPVWDIDENAFERILEF